MPRYKVLKSVAHNIAHSFTSTLNYREGDYVMGHLLRRARKIGVGSLDVDLLTGSAHPDELCVRPVRDALNTYVEHFADKLSWEGSDIALVRSARFLISFDLSVVRPNAFSPSLRESPYRCRVEIADDRGKTWEAELAGWWNPGPTKPWWKVW